MKYKNLTLIFIIITITLCEIKIKITQATSPPVLMTPSGPPSTPSPSAPPPPTPSPPIPPPTPPPSPSPTPPHPPLSTLIPIPDYIGTFGSAIEISNDFAVIGSYTATYNPCGSCGTATIWHYSLGSWNFLSILKSYDGTIGDNFGRSVAISSSPLRAVIGSIYHSINSTMGAGAVYIFEPHPTNLSNWINTTQLTSPLPEATGYFGCSIALSSTYIIIGEVNKNVGFVDNGAAHIFSYQNSSWIYLKQLIASDPHNYDAFGSSVAIDNDIILISSLNGDSMIVDSGAAYIFGQNTGGTNNWGFATKIVSPIPIASSSFGGSLILSNDFAFIGQFGSDSVYGFSRNNGGIDNWGFSANISNPIGQVGINFGYGIAIQETTMQESNMIIGGPWANGRSGIVQVLQSSNKINWNSMYIIYNSDTMGSDYFGYSVAMDNNHVMIGVPYKNFNVGQVYYMELPNPSMSPRNELQLILLIIVISSIIIGSSIGIIIAISKRHKKGDNRGSDDLLEFSSHKDMNFIDIHGPNQPKKRRSSLESGSSIATSSTQYSNVTISSIEST